MQFTETLRLRAEWEKKGCPHCDHHYEREYHKSMHTGDHACIYCGDQIDSMEYRRH